MDTLWRLVHDLYSTGRYEWNVGEPVGTLNGGQQCMCVGGAIAFILTGKANSMYGLNRRVETALLAFADHVDAPTDAVTASERVYKWNDNLPYRDGKETVLRVLEELDVVARAECRHVPYHGVCIFCNREDI